MLNILVEHTGKIPNIPTQIAKQMRSVYLYEKCLRK